LIVTNTTLSRPQDLSSNLKQETGGLSGRPLKDMANRVTKRMYELTKGKVIIIGVGGIENGADALERIKSGATLVQIYTAMAYDGPTVVSRIKRELINSLK
jgi:dihydroorotate dehydrogenase